MIFKARISNHNYQLIAALLVLSVLETQGQSFFRLAEGELLNQVEVYVVENDIRVVRLTYDFPAEGYFFAEKRSYNEEGKMTELLVSGHEGYKDRKEGVWWPFAYKQNLYYDSSGQLLRAIDTIKNYRTPRVEFRETYYEYERGTLIGEVSHHRLARGSTDEDILLSIDSIRHEYEAELLTTTVYSKYEAKYHKRKGWQITGAPYSINTVNYRYEGDRIIEQTLRNEEGEIKYLLTYGYEDDGLLESGIQQMDKEGPIRQNFELIYTDCIASENCPNSSKLIRQVNKNTLQRENVIRTVYYNEDNSINYIDENGIKIRFNYATVFN